jgi:hypothetical protein
VSKPEIRSVLFLSTGHLTVATREVLDQNPLTDAYPISGGPIPYGFFVYADEDIEEPTDLAACCQFARTLPDVDYIRFDCDVEALEELPFYD